VRISGVVLVAVAAIAVGCSGKTPSRPPPIDAGFFIPDAGPPPCTVACHEVPDAGVDAGYVARPLIIASVVPHRGPITGGASVQLTGTGFLHDFDDRASNASKESTVLVGGNPALDYTVISDSIALFTAPPGQAGDVDVVLTNPNGTATCRGCFTSYAPLLLQSLTPGAGPLAGGTVVALSGKGLSAQTTVLFGDKAATAVTFDAATRTLHAVAPPGQQVGSVDVRVFNGNGTSSLRQAFRYQGAPVLLGLSPAGGPTAGGTAIDVTGRGLSDVTACSIGAAAAQVLLQDDGHLELVSPPGAEGRVDVTCTGPGGASTLRQAFTYFDPQSGTLRLLGLGPTHGPPEGGNTVTLVGGGLGGVSGVSFGGASATILARTSNTLTVRVPPGPAHTTVDVALSSGTVLAAAYTYNLALSAVRPSHGPQAGGTALLLDGAGFVPGVQVTVGGVAATGVVPQSPVLLQAQAPAGPGGASRVRVEDPTDPEDFAELVSGFSYDASLVIGAVLPASGSVAGGTFATLYGSGFAQGMEVDFGGSRAKDLTVVDSHTATLHTPAHAVGSVPVQGTLDGVTARVADGFSYIDPTNQGGGATGGPLSGTLNVTVLDSTFTQFGQPVVGATVILGIDASTPFQGTTDANGQLTLSDPALSTAQDVSVSKAGYESVTVVGQASQNMTVYIGQNDGTGGSPGGGGQGVSPVTISGTVNGFKAPHPLQPYEHEECHVRVAPHSLFYAPPFSGDDRPSAGEKALLTADGASYLRLVYPGLYAIAATYGIRDDRTGTFTPVLMGIARGIEVSGTHPADHANVVLDIHLDVTAPVTILAPLTSPGSPAPAVNTVYAYLDLGGEGVVPLTHASSVSPSLFVGGLPELDGANLVFVNQSGVGGSPLSYFFRREPGDVRSGVSLGPMLGFVQITAPAPGADFLGSVAFDLGPGPPADLAQLQISTPTAPLWTVILPGSQRQASLPQGALTALLDHLPPGTPLVINVTADRAPRFDYGHWSYGDLGLLSWTSFSFGSTQSQLPSLPDGGP
jgi:hypothetical protein